MFIEKTVIRSKGGTMSRIVKRMSAPVKGIQKSGKTAYLNCGVGYGMFNGEKIVSVTVGQEAISIIVGDSAISQGRLQVDVYGKKGNHYLIGFPGETFSASRKMWVDQKELHLK